MKKNTIFLKYLEVIACVSSIGIMIISLTSEFSTAQVLADQTLGKSSSIPIQKPSGTLIVGGKKSGKNLFHSFSSFNVQQDEAAYFRTPQGVVNIIGRVTSQEISNIRGTLGVRGNANLIFLNKNGINFGRKSRLDLNNSFLVTTATGIEFRDSGRFSFNTQSDFGLLNTAPQSLFFDRNPNASIRVNANQVLDQRPEFDPSFKPETLVDLMGMRVKDGKSLLLLGGNVLFDDGHLTALGGNVEIASLRAAGKIDLMIDDQNIKLGFPKKIDGGTIRFSNQSSIDVSSNDAGLASGNVHIVSDNIIFSDSTISAQSNSLQNSGDLLLSASRQFQITGLDSKISTFTSGKGVGGSIKIKTNHFKGADGALIDSQSGGFGQGGDIRIDANKSFVISGVVELGNNLLPTTILSGTIAAGNSGDIEITVSNGSIQLLDGARIDASSTGTTGVGGDVILQASESVEISGVSNVYGGIEVGSNSRASAGSIRIHANKFVLKDENRVSASSDRSQDGGDIFIIASDSVDIEGFSEITSKGTGEGGLLNISTKNLNLDSSILNAETSRNTNRSSGGATILLNVSDRISLSNDSFISAEAFGKASGGNILIINTPNLFADAPRFFGNDIAANADIGQGGNIIINARRVTALKEGIQADNRNDIDASGELRQGLVEINTLTDLNQGFIELPKAIINPDTLIAQNPCSNGTESEFTLSGKGGLPVSINESLRNEQTQVMFISPSPTDHSRITSTDDTNTSIYSKKLINKSSKLPAQGWTYDEQGKVTLVAYNTQVSTPTRLNQQSGRCST